MTSSLLIWIVILGAPVASAAAQDGATPVEQLLPANSIMLVGTDDLAAMCEQSKSMPLNKILEEQEVKAFLKQPRETMEKMLKEVLGKLKSEQGIDVDLNRILNTNYRRFFLALTHVVIEESNVDVGFVLGIEPIGDTLDALSLASDLLKQQVAKKSEGNADAKTGKVTDETYSGVNLRRFSGPDPTDPSVFFARKGSLSLVSFSERLIKGMLDRMQSPAKDSLAGDPEFGLVSQKLGARPKGSFYTFLNPKTLCEAMFVPLKKKLTDDGKQDWVPKVDSLYAASGLADLKSVGAVSYTDNGVAVAKAFVHAPGELHGLLGLMKGLQPIDRKKLAWIPKAAQSFSMGQFGLAKLYDTAMELAEIVQPDLKAQAEQAIQGTIQQLSGGAQGGGSEQPYDLRRDLLGNLEGEFITYQMAAQGVGATGDMLAITKVKDQEKIRKGLDLVLKVPSMFEIPIHTKEQDLDGTKATVVDLSSGELGALAMFAGSIQPCYAFKNGYLLVSLSTNGLKSAIGRFEKSPDSIAEAEDFARAFGRLPAGKDPVNLSYTNVKGGFEAMYNGLVTMTMIPQVSQMLQEIPIDLALLPTADSVSKHLFGSVEASYADVDGYTTIGYSPFGGEAVLAGIAAVGFVGTSVYNSQRLKMSSPGGPTEGAPGGNNEMSQPEQVQIQLGLLRAAITVYKLDHDDQLPPTLKDLLKPSENYPNGYLGGAPELPKDPWQHDYVYEVAGPKSYKLRSMGPNGVDDKGAGDDISGR